MSNITHPELLQFLDNLSSQDLLNLIEKSRQFDQCWETLSVSGVPTQQGFHPKQLSLWQRIELFSSRQVLEELRQLKAASDGVQQAGPPLEARPVQTFDQQSADIEPAIESKPSFKLSSDQERAWKKLQSWLVDADAPKFILRGFAGTGKTHLMKLLTTVRLNKQRSFYFTAPTNQATKVLSNLIEHPAKTIYSLLGLRMSSDDETQELVFPERLPELDWGCIIVVDEAGMLPKQMVEFIEQARRQFDAKVLYVGDPAQLLPIGEDESPCWNEVSDKRYRTLMKKVMRFDNQILKLATHLRECVFSGEAPVVVDDNDGNEGVFKLSSRAEFMDRLLDGRNTPADFMDTKVAAWRNKAVNRYTEEIRRHLGFGSDPYQETELLLLAQPVEIGGNIVATIDERVCVEKRLDTFVTAYQGLQIPVHRAIVRTDTNGVLTLNIPTEDDIVLQDLLSNLADKAKRAKGTARRDAWRLFWQQKNQFHRVRYAYAMTTHRLQGSTVKNIFMDSKDILANPDSDTANRCMYVGATRATFAAYIL